MATPTLPPIRACLFDMDGLLINTEDLYTTCINVVLERHGRPKMPWSIKAQLQGRTAPEANRMFLEWAGLPVTPAEYLAEFTAQQRELFPTSELLPGVETLLADLARTQRWEGQSGGLSDKGHKVHIALATSSTTVNYGLKTSHLTSFFSVFPPEQRVLGDDPRVAPGRGKPLPDIYLVALETINARLPPSEPKIKPEECLVFEDSVPGVESGRRAGMRVIWVPHPMLKDEFNGREDEVLAGRTGAAGHGVDEHALGEIGDGWGEYLPSLERFPYEKYGIIIPPPEKEADPKADAKEEELPVPEEVKVVA